MNKRINKTNWQYIFLRNVSLFQLSMWVEGQKHNGFLPALNYKCKDQLNIYKPREGNYYYFDTDLMKRVMKIIQHDIDYKPNFAQNLRKRANLLYKENLAVVKRVKNIDFSKLTNKEFFYFYDEFITIFCTAPIITMPYWGVEACLDPDYKLIKFLKKKLKELGKEDQLGSHEGYLSVADIKTVAFEDKEAFLNLAINLYKNEKVKQLFLGNLKSEQIEKILEQKYPKASKLIDKYIESYKWIITEYITPPWPKSKYIANLQALFKTGNPKKELKKHLNKFALVQKRKKETIKELDPPEEILKVMKALEEFNYEMDYSKGIWCQVFILYNNMIKTLAKRLDCSKMETLFHSMYELYDFLEKSKKINIEIIRKRMKEGYSIIMKDEEIRVYTGEKEIKRIEKEESIILEIDKKIEEIKGQAASPGKVKGKVRLIKEVADLPELQKGEIVVTYMTTMEYTPAFHIAKAIVTDEGGLACHAAIVAREFKLPCVVGTGFATRILENGEEIEVDGESGLVRRLKLTK